MLQVLTFWQGVVMLSRNLRLLFASTLPSFILWLSTLNGAK